MSLSFKQKPIDFTNPSNGVQFLKSPIKDLAKNKNIDLGSNPFQQKVAAQGDIQINLQEVNQNDPFSSSNCQYYQSNNAQNLTTTLNEEEANKMLMVLKNKMFNESVSFLEDSILQKSEKKQNHQKADSIFDRKTFFLHDDQLINEGNNNGQMNEINSQVISNNVTLEGYEYNYGQKARSTFKNNNNLVYNVHQNISLQGHDYRQIADNKVICQYNRQNYKNQLTDHYQEQQFSSKCDYNKTQNIEKEYPNLIHQQQQQLYSRLPKSNIETLEDLDENVSVNFSNFMQDLKMKPAYSKHKLSITGDKKDLNTRNDNEFIYSNFPSKDISINNYTNTTKAKQELQFQNHQTFNDVIKTNDIKSSEEFTLSTNAKQGIKQNYIQSVQTDSAHCVNDIATSSEQNLKQFPSINKLQYEDVNNISLKQFTEKENINKKIIENKETTVNKSFNNKIPNGSYSQNQEKQMNQNEELINCNQQYVKNQQIEKEYQNRGDYQQFENSKAAQDKLNNNYSNNIKNNQDFNHKIIQDTFYQKCHLLKMESRMSEAASQKDIPATQTSTEPDNSSFVNSTHRDFINQNDQIKNNSYSLNVTQSRQFNDRNSNEGQSKDEVNSINLKNQGLGSLKSSINVSNYVNLQNENCQILTNNIPNSFLKSQDNSQELQNETPTNLNQALPQEEKSQLSKYLKDTKSIQRNNFSLHKSSNQYYNKKTRSNTNNSRNNNNSNNNQLNNTTVNNFQNSNNTQSNTFLNSTINNNAQNITRNQTEQFSDLLKKIKNKRSNYDQVRSFSPMNKISQNEQKTNQQKHTSVIQAQQIASEKNTIHKSVFYSKRCSLTEQLLHKNQKYAVQDKDENFQLELRRQTYQTGDPLPLHLLNAQANKNQRNNVSKYLSPKQNSIQISIQEIENYPLTDLKNKPIQQQKYHQQSWNNPNKSQLDETKLSNILKLNQSQSPCLSSRMKSQFTEIDFELDDQRTYKNKENASVKQHINQHRQSSVKNSISRNAKISNNKMIKDKPTTQTLKQILKDSTIKQAQLSNYRSFSKLF